MHTPYLWAVLELEAAQDPSPELQDAIAAIDPIGTLQITSFESAPRLVDVFYACPTLATLQQTQDALQALPEIAAAVPVLYFAAEVGLPLWIDEIVARRAAGA